jgi:hypothetical protein
MKWVRGQWLSRSNDADGSEVYTLTSHARPSPVRW